MTNTNNTNNQSDFDAEILARFERLKATNPVVKKGTNDSKEDAELVERLTKLTGSTPVAVSSVPSITTLNTLKSHYVDFTELVLTSPLKQSLSHATNFNNNFSDEDNSDSDEVSDLLSLVKQEIELEKRTSNTERDIESDEVSELELRLRRLSSDFKPSASYSTPTNQPKGHAMSEVADEEMTKHVGVRLVFV
ncbi:hypothetical protein BCR33DRAFT_715424 [Rhizoclosmatium globosum]|uniref:Uncharacterized protein n=1 Tax=Rhizoclosmatium globosum TaxID=329046 RepID=A0A1Y2CJ56_9FUNG|nr:hypothetical protein BCR33DRAFT_715424 [Rhizoclosmatium globosum]|eukprot:ORY47059.1 hypothetical protein BCR33DRAFT_715424 [Rhizoclosmatium globosum]